MASDTVTIWLSVLVKVRTNETLEIGEAYHTFDACENDCNKRNKALNTPSSLYMREQYWRPIPRRLRAVRGS